MKITDHFTLAEWASHDGASYPTEWIDARLRPLCQVLETLRAALGGHPMVIVSGYRSPAHNRAIGGAARSQHMEGRAADVVVAGVAPSLVHAKALELARAGKIEIGGLGAYTGWTHLDIRPRPSSGHLAQWRGAGFGSEVV